MMDFRSRIEVLIELGKRIKDFKEKSQYKSLLTKVYGNNPWFINDFVNQAIDELVNNYLDEEKLNIWLSGYQIKNDVLSKKIGLTLAGNIPLVGIHDIICTFVTGHISLLKMSSKDKVLLPFILKLLFEIDERAKGYFSLVERNFKDFDAIIATGSDNSSRYFEYYFGKYPNIIRKNRNSVAILTGDENPVELSNLGKDIFQYFGLGCRNVSKLYVPENYNFERLFENMNDFENLMNHNKYINNYIYNKSIMMVNQDQFFDNGFLLLKEDLQIASPVSLLYYEYYKNIEELTLSIGSRMDEIQAVIGNNISSIKTIPFGNSQNPELWDYADGIDTIEFLNDLN